MEPTSPQHAGDPTPAAPAATVLVDRVDRDIAVVTLNRPHAMNALDAPTVQLLDEQLEALASDRECRAIVLTGAGRGFCAGLDLKGYGTAPGAEGLGKVQTSFATQQHMAGLVARLRDLPQPVIAAINGAAAGGGLALALGCDVRVGSTAARFNVAFVKLGLSGCDMGLSWLLPRLVGASTAFELMLTGRTIDAEEADRIGLVLRIVPDGAALDAALEVARNVAANSAWGVRMTKEVMWSQLEVGSLRAGIDLENRTQILSTFTEDMQDAVQAFRAKRAPAER